MSKPTTKPSSGPVATTHDHTSNPTPKTPTTNKKQTATLLQLAGGCISDGCNKKSEKAGFCLEHFDWFKEGLITKEGHKPTDFEKKFFNYQRRKRAA